MLIYIGIPLMILIVLAITGLIIALPKIMKNPEKRDKLKAKILEVRDNLFLGTIMRTFVATYLLLCFKAKITESVSGAQYESNFTQKILTGICFGLPLSIILFHLYYEDP